MRPHESSKWRFGEEIRSIRSVKAINAPWAAETPVPQGQPGIPAVGRWVPAGPRHAPRLPRIRSARCSACSRGIRAWSSRCDSCSARMNVHQFKLNAKAPFEGDVWQWHQDDGTWARDDSMPEPRAMNIAVFLDAVMPINGAAVSHSEEPQGGCAQRRSRQVDHVISALDSR